MLSNILKPLGAPFIYLLFISASIGNIKIPLFQENLASESLLLLFISAVSIVQIANSKPQSSVKFPEIFFLLFFVYATIKTLLANNVETSALCYLLFFILLYYCLRLIFAAYNFPAYSFTLLKVTVIILFADLVFAIYHCYFKKETLTNFFIPNKSIFSILLASQIAMVLPLYLHFKKSVFKLTDQFFIIIISSSVFLLGATLGRAGWFGLILALVYIGFQNLSNTKFKKVILYFLFPFLLLVFTLLFWYKSGSSAGRVLIYKISAGILKDNWLWGIGHGQFKAKYNEYQAAYFSTHSIDSKEALLADNSIYAFNDFFQAVIENGLFAFLILVAIIFLLLRQIKGTEVNKENKHLFTAALASLICILTASLFSYSLQIFPIAVQATLSLAIIHSFPSSQKLQIELSEKVRKVGKLVMLSLSSMLFVHFCFYFRYKTISNRAFQFKRTGYKQKAIENYAAINNSYIKDGNVMYSYAQELYYSNELQLAKEVINKARKYYVSYEIYQLSAAIENELHNYTQAEKDFKMAIYSVPNRMISRKSLLEFYLERKDTANAIYWANSILFMPVKVPSQTTGNIQQKTKEILMQISK